MIVINLWLAAVSLAANAPTQPNCMGVAVETSTGMANLVSLHIEGPSASIDKIKAVSAPLGVDFFKEEKAAEIGKIDLVFSTRTKSADAMTLYERLAKDEFGKVAITPWIMSIDTLPVDKCPRS